MWALLQMEIADEYATDLDSLSARYYDQDEVFGDTDAVPQTYQKIVEALSSGLDERGIILYQHIVEHISFGSSSTGATITCRRSDTNEVVTLGAQRVICTLPLGVLKQRAATLFDPPLPNSLQGSIGRLGFGCLEKVWLQFRCPPFWPTDSDAFYHAASDTPFREWFLPARVYRDAAYERTLCCFVAGSKARALADLSSPQVAAQALAALRQILTVPSGDDDDESLIQHVHVTRWSTDPWSGHGSYSHLAVGSTPKDFTVWESSCFDNRLWFAGEASHVKYPATVHGAYLSGERAARSCLKNLA